METKKYDYVIIGSGLAGATFAHLAGRKGKRCLVVERREHLGGNIYCEQVEGINVHKYGAHIFHTSNKRVWEFVNSLVEFNRFTNSPVACHEGKLYNLPFNMNTFYQMWGVRTPAEALAEIERQRADAKRAMEQAGVAEPRNLEEQAMLLAGRDIYEKLVKGYTEKQWGRPCTELPAFIIKRLPVRLTFDNNYFNDTYQGIPIGGYNKLIDALLKDADTLTGVDYFDDRQKWHNMGTTLVYTGMIDRFFDYCCGQLQYRSLRFEHETLQMANYQGNAVINYTEASIPYTRIIEHKHFEMNASQVEQCPVTVVTKEYPAEWKPGMEPYYAVNNEQNMALLSQYKNLAAQEPGTIFVGRLAEYKYYDMAPLIERVMQITDRILKQ